METNFEVAQNRITDGIGHVFSSEEIAYIEEQGFTLEQVRAVLAKIPEGADALTIETLLGEAAQATDPSEPNVKDPTDPSNEGSGESPAPEPAT